MPLDHTYLAPEPTHRWHDWLTGLAAIYAAVMAIVIVGDVEGVLSALAVVGLAAYYQAEARGGQQSLMSRAALQTAIVAPGAAATVVLVREKFDLVLGDELSIWPGPWQMWAVLPFFVAALVLAMYLPETWSDAFQSRRARRDHATLQDDDPS